MREHHMNPILDQQLDGLAQAVAAAKASLPALDRCAELIADCLERGGKILAAGNGGSACDALHLCEELVGRYRDNRRALPAISLAADGTTLTCIGNDFGFDQIFARQVEALGQTGDVLVLFTSSGNSPNLLRALEAARGRGLKTVALTGRGGGKLAGRADAEWIVPSDHGARVQELQTWAVHVILEVVEARLFA
jgi:D-sedoheptulose 7-phosphate isomerase